MPVYEDDNELIVQGSGDIFADLDVQISEEDIIKIEIAREITRVIHARKYKQVDVARRLGISQARVSDITRGKLDRFKADRLLQYLLALGVNIDVHTSDADATDVDSAHGRVRFHKNLKNVSAACG